MHPIRQSLLNAYRTVTTPLRQMVVRRMAQRGAAPACVLFYHRVADTHPNGWTMPVEMFERQLDWLAERFDFVSLSEAQRRLDRGKNHRRCVTITFDDGYAENCDHAIPLLLRRNIPFTYFVTTGIVRDQTAFPHDLKAGVRLPPNTIDQIKAMSNAGVDIGAHTRTHPDLGRITDPDRLRDEIVGSIEDLQEWTGRRPTSFAIPYGQVSNTTPETMRVAQEAGITAVCTAYGAYNLPDQLSPEFGSFHVRRIHGDPDWARFTNWMTVDPRKLVATDPIDDYSYVGCEGSAPSREVEAAGV